MDHFAIGSHSGLMLFDSLSIHRVHKPSQMPFHAISLAHATT